MSALPRLPYFSQFASRELVNAFLARPHLTADDPDWKSMGWPTSREYAFWAWQTCGVACLRSIVALDGRQPSAAALTEDLILAGAYRISDGGTQVSSLIYAPFAEYVTKRWGLQAETRGQLRVDELRNELLEPACAAMVSVHPSVRDAETNLSADWPRPGGHLVLAHDATPEVIRFHNPSGYWPSGQSSVELPWSCFARFYANRGILMVAPGRVVYGSR